MSAEEDLSPLSSRSFEGIEARPRHFKHTKEDGNLIEELIAGTFGDKLEKAIQKADLPASVKHHPFYPALIKGKQLPYSKEDLKAKQRNRARHIPQRPNEVSVQTALNFFAINILNVLETEGAKVEPENKGKVIGALVKILNKRLRENLEVVAASPLFYLGKRRGGHKDILVSTNEIKAAVKTVKTKVDSGEINREEADVALLLELEAIDNREIKSKCKKKSGNGNGNEGELNLADYDLSRLNDEISSSLQWAQEHGNKKLNWMNKLVNHFVASGEIKGEFKRPGFKDSLRFDDLFDLLQKLFDPTCDPRNANDIQIILNLALMHWTWERAFKEVKPKHLKELEEAMMSSSFVEKPNDPQTELKGPVLKFVDDAEDPRFEVANGAPEIQEVYTLKPRFCPKGETIHILSYKMGKKETDSGVGKHLDSDQGRLIPERITDYFRTRFMLWGITSERMKNDQALKRKMETMIEKMAEDLHLEHWNLKEPKPGDLFVKWQLAGKTKDGIPLEIQWIPHDTYLFETADDSGLAHNVYSEARDIERWRVKVPPSISEVLQEAFALREKELDGKRARTKKAMRNFNFESLGF